MFTAGSDPLCQRTTWVCQTTRLLAHLSRAPYIQTVSRKFGKIVQRCQRLGEDLKTKALADFHPEQLFSPGGNFNPLSLPGDIWQWLETFLVVTMWGEGTIGIRWLEVRAAAKHNVQDSSSHPTKN